MFHAFFTALVDALRSHDDFEKLSLRELHEFGLYREASRREAEPHAFNEWPW